LTDLQSGHFLKFNCLNSRVIGGIIATESFIMSSQPFFTIITCTLNSQKYLDQNIASVKKQTFKNFEHIFIDGFSKDKTLKIIKSYQKNKTNVFLFDLKPRGIAQAMNLGIKKAQGKYLIHLHSDDLFHDQKVLEDVYRFLSKNPKYDWIYGQINVIKNDQQINKIFPNLIIFQISWSYLLKFADFIPHQAVFIKKSVFKNHGLFDEKNPSAMDYDFWLRIRNKTNWGFFNRLISDFRIHSDSKSTGKENLAKHIKVRNAVQRKYTNIFEYQIVLLINKLIDWNYKKRIS
jgi:glycosyltransferase involved in cell wall biosynthesis